MDREKAKKLKEIQDATYQDMLNVLEEHHLCNVERPTGFGKTKMFMQYAKEHPDDKVLYIYDVSSVPTSIEHDYKPENVQFLSYAMLSRKAAADNVKNILLDIDYKAVIFDESHLLGGENISKLAHEVIPEIVKQGRYVIGGTATPTRTDLVNVTKRFFGGHRTQPYTLEEAFDDGIITAPLWTVMLYSQRRIKADLEKAKGNPYAIDRLRQLEHAYAKRIGAPGIYRNTVLEQYGGAAPSYMKFIVFYPTIKSLNDNAPELEHDFSAAFPDHEIVLYPVSSDPEHFNNCVALDTDEQPENRIDLILAVDMLNQSYHSSTLTGIIMNRSTMSNIVFTQQLGRCLSVASDKRAIVFDNVGNAETDPLEALGSLQNLLNDPTKGPPTGRVRGFRSMELLVRPEELEIAQWYQRIHSTLDVTQEQINIAKRLYTKFMAPSDYIDKAYKVPEWLLREELGDAWGD